MLTAWRALPFNRFDLLVCWTHRSRLNARQTRGRRNRRAGRASACGQVLEKQIGLRVLYAGDPKSERTAGFRSFLEAHFLKVGVADYLSLNEAQTNGYDVVVLDWPGLPPREGGEFKHPALERSYCRPTVLIGGGTLAVGRLFALKLDDLCVCLGDAAHGVRADHELFQRPYKIHLVLEDRPTPRHYRNWPEGEHLPPTIKVWKVQERGWSADRPNDFSVMPGMVSDPYGFADSPDAEAIAAGINTMGPAAIAIGRQGNFLLWGFHAAPAELTPEAHKCLVNAICYVRKFEGQRPLVRKIRGQLARDWSLVYALSYKAVSDREQFAQSQPEAVRADPKKLTELHHASIEQYRNMFPEDLRRQLGTDADRYISYCRDNLEFLHPRKGPAFPFEVDEDVRGLGLSNRKIELLDKCITMLEKRDRPELASRMLRRYTTESFTDADQWRRWLEASRDRLFFTDSGGYKFMVAPKAWADRPATRADGAAPGTKPLTLALAELSPGTVRPGETLELVVRVELAPTWHIYAVGRSRGPGASHDAERQASQGAHCRGHVDLARAGLGHGRPDDLRREAGVPPPPARR